jgi:hypothetical protein
MIAPNARRLLLLGPQPKYVSLRKALDRAGIDQPAALITAGWQDEEQNDEDVLKSLPRASVNLNLFQRSEQLFAEDDELIKLFRDRQDELRILRDSYRLRLDYVLEAAREIFEINAQSTFDFDAECELAIDQLRQLDRQYYFRTTKVCDDYDEKLDTLNRELVARHRHEIQEELEKCSCLVISGGHAAIILNRLRIFGVLEMAPELPVVAWSAGAMALAKQLVLFHDSPPQGRGNPEVLRAGQSLYDDFLPLPNARRRLKLDDRTRVSLFARRFNELECIELNEDSILDRQNGEWNLTRCSRLNADGSVEELGR